MSENYKVAFLLSQNKKFLCPKQAPLDTVTEEVPAGLPQGCPGQVTCPEHGHLPPFLACPCPSSTASPGSNQKAVISRRTILHPRSRGE